jgi:hypothetical protein
LRRRREGRNLSGQAAAAVRMEVVMPLQRFILTMLLLGAACALAPTPARAQLSAYSCEALWHERNAIYARNGYCFKTERAIAEFGAGCFPPFGRLSGREADRVRQVQYWERSNGCPN